MTRQEAIVNAAAAVNDAADYDIVGSVNVFGEINTNADIDDVIRKAVENLAGLLAQTDAEWAKKA